MTATSEARKHPFHSPDCIKTVSSAAGSLTFLGDGSQKGSYVLRIRVDNPLRMAFGRFKRGRRIEVEAGDYSYVGSALTDKGATCLARRIVRHASRTAGKQPHGIRELMEVEFSRIRLGDAELRPRSGKHLCWHVDHLLDQASATLSAAYVIRWPYRVERGLGQLLLQDPSTVMFEAGLGANDLPGCTHLLRVNGGEEWWAKLSEKLCTFVLSAEPESVACVRNPGSRQSKRSASSVNLNRD